MAVLTTSGNSVYNQSATELISTAFQICQVINDEETPTGAQMQAGLDALNIMAKHLQASGAHLWLQEDAILFLQPSQATYQLGSGSPDHACLFSDLTQTNLPGGASMSATNLTVASIAGIASGNTIGITLANGTIFWTTVNGAPSGTTVVVTTGLPSAASAGALVFDYTYSLPRSLKVAGARVYTLATGVETPLIPMSRLDYANTSQKTQSTGLVQYFFFDPQTGKDSYSQLISLFNVSPAPSGVTQAVRFTAQRPIQDFTTLANLPDFPAEWLAVLKWGLAAELAPQYGVPTEIYQMIAPIAKAKMDMLQAWDTELQGTTTYPFSQAVFQIIARALRLCNACGPKDVPDYGMVQNAFIALNAMVQSWQGMSIHLWCEEEGILFAQTGQTLYNLGSASTDFATLYSSLTQTSLLTTALGGATSVTVLSTNGMAVGDNISFQLDSGYNFWTTVATLPGGNVVTINAPLPSQMSASTTQLVFDYTTPLIRPLRMYSSRRYDYSSKIENPMIMLARLDYQNLPNKYNQGIMTQTFFDPQLNLSQLNIWPTPSSYQYGVRFTAQRPLTTFQNLTSVQDFPAEWANALAFNLAVDLWPEYGTAPERDPRASQAGQSFKSLSVSAGLTFQSLSIMAAEKLRVAMAWDREPEGVLFGFAMEPGYKTG